MDIYALYDLPQPPPPTVFSLDKGPNRARFPNFTSVVEVADFLDKTIVWRHNQAADRLLLVTSAYLILLLLSLPFFILPKIASQSFWLFRLEPRPEGRRLIPHVHYSWMLSFAGALASLVAASLASHVYTVRSVPMPHIAIWITTLWTPITFAAWFQTCGVRMARSKRAVAAKALARRTTAVPTWLINTTNICLPILPSCLALCPGLISDAHLERSRHAWSAWHEAYADVTVISRDMLIDAQHIWKECLMGCYALTFALIIWIATALGFGTAHTIASIGFVADMTRHIKKRRKRIRFYRTQASNASVPVVDGDFAVDGSPADKRPSPGELLRIEVGSDNNSNDSKVAGFAPHRQGPEQRHVFSYEDDEYIHSEMFSDDAVQNNIAASFFPPVAPSSLITKIEQKAARKMLWWFTLQSFSVMAGYLALASTVAFMARHFYPAAERGNPEPVFMTTYTVVCGSGMITGTLTTISVMHKTFEQTVAALLSVRLSADDAEATTEQSR
ncbi:hypothetical protein V8E36_000850 [Tilletia maclaganii]